MSKGPGGARCKLIPAQLEELQALLQAGPAAWGWPDQCWTLPRIAAVVRERFGVDYTLPGLALLLHRLGWSMQVPARRADVLDQLANERRSVSEGASEYGQPFLGLARDWRRLLFPTASDQVFADGCAQAVTFALLLARTEDIELTGSLHEIGTQLGGAEHSLMGRALQLLTDNIAANFKVTLNLLVRVVEAVDWTGRSARRGVCNLSTPRRWK